MPRLDPPVTIAEAEIDHALQPPPAFGYIGERDMFRTWALGPIIRSRDSDLVTESNADALIRHLESDPSLADDWEVTSANHWALGWVDHLSFRAVDEHGSPTRIFRVLEDWFARLDEYPIADEDDLAAREYEATLDAIEQIGRQLADTSRLPADWQFDCYSWLAEHRPHAIESRDGHGGYPSDEDMIACLDVLGRLDPEEP